MRKVVTIRRALFSANPYQWRIRCDATSARYTKTLNELLPLILRELNMKYTHLLELSTTEPRQYRITVLEEKPASMITQMLEHGEGFKIVGWYDSPEELLAVLVPYLQMEQGK